MIVSCRLKHHFEYTRKSAGGERKGPLSNNMRESAFHVFNAQIGQFLARQISTFSILVVQEIDEAIKSK